MVPWALVTADGRMGGLWVEGYKWQHAPSLAAARTTRDHRVPQTRRYDTGVALDVIHPRQSRVGCLRGALEPAGGLHVSNTNDQVFLLGSMDFLVEGLNISVIAVGLDSIWEIQFSTMLAFFFLMSL